MGCVCYMSVALSLPEIWERPDLAATSLQGSFGVHYVKYHIFESMMGVLTTLIWITLHSHVQCAMCTLLYIETLLTWKIHQCRLGEVHHIEFCLTRPKPPYVWQGLAGFWGKDTIRWVHFGVFSTSHFSTRIASDFLVTDGGVPTDLSGHSLRK